MDVIFGEKTMQREANLKSVQRVWGAYKTSTGSSQSKAAKAMGMNQSAFSQYVRGEIPLNTDFLIKFGSLTNTDLSDLGVDSSAPKQAIRSVTLPLLYTLSGSRLHDRSVQLDSVIAPGDLFAIYVDYTDYILPQGTIVVVDKSAAIKEGERVVYTRGENDPLVQGTITHTNDGWEIIEPHWFGGRKHMVDVQDVENIFKISSAHLPNSRGKAFKG